MEKRIPKVSHLIVTWNNESIVTDCIDTLFQFSPVENEVIVVDNASTDATCAVIRQRYGDKVRLIEAGENLGFSKANNLALSKATGDYVFFVNPDVIFIEDIITPMIQVLERHPEIGIVSPRLLYEDGSYQVSSCNYPSIAKVFWDDLHFYKLLPTEKQKRLAQAQYRGEENRFVDWTYGAAHFCRYEEVVKVGGYPVGYFMYGEDTEFCMSFLHQLGLKNYYLGQAKLIHLGGYSEKQVLNSRKIVYGTNAAMYFVNKYYGKGSLIRYRVLLFIASFIKHLAAWFKCLVNRSQKNLNSKLKWSASWKTVLRYRGGQN